MVHAKDGFWPILNKGELAVLYCFVFLCDAGSACGRRPASARSSTRSPGSASSGSSSARRRRPPRRWWRSSWAGWGSAAGVLGKRADRRRDPLRFYARARGAGRHRPPPARRCCSVSCAPAYVAHGRHRGARRRGGHGGAAGPGGPGAPAADVPGGRHAGRGRAGRREPRATGGGAPPRCSTASTRWARSRAAWPRPSSLLEVFGTRRTLWLAALLERSWWRWWRGRLRAVAPTTTPDDAASEAPASAAQAAAPPALRSLAAAAAVGFAFFLMELVWYRMLGPMLGGTVVHVRADPGGGARWASASAARSTRWRFGRRRRDARARFAAHLPARGGAHRPAVRRSATGSPLLAAAPAAAGRRLGSRGLRRWAGALVTARRGAARRRSSPACSSRC